MKRRWIYDDEGNAHEVSQDFVAVMNNHDALLWNDRLYQDDGDKRYMSRAQHQDYMKRNDLSLVGDYTETWNRAAKDRADFFAGKDSGRKEDINRAIEKLNNGRR